MNIGNEKQAQRANDWFKACCILDNLLVDDPLADDWETLEIAQEEARQYDLPKEDRQQLEESSIEENSRAHRRQLGQNKLMRLVYILSGL